jgi:hypothetical protein
MTPDRRDVAGWRCSEAVAIAPSSRIPIPPDFGRAPWRLLNISRFVAAFSGGGSGADRRTDRPYPNGDDPNAKRD